jgi:hypothetical protein
MSCHHSHRTGNVPFMQQSKSWSPQFARSFSITDLLLKRHQINFPKQASFDSTTPKRV